MGINAGDLVTTLQTFNQEQREQEIMENLWAPCLLHNAMFKLWSQQKVQVVQKITTKNMIQG